MPLFSKNKNPTRTRVELIAEAPSTTLHWGPSGDCSKGKGSTDTDPFTALRRLCSPIAEEEELRVAEFHEQGEEETGRPRFCGVAHFTLDFEFDALLSALNSTTLDSLTVMLQGGGLFPSADAFIAALGERLEIRPRRLIIHILSERLPLDAHAVGRTICAWPRATEMDHISVHWFPQWDVWFPKWGVLKDDSRLFGKLKTQALQRVGHSTERRENPRYVAPETEYEFERKQDWIMTRDAFRSLAVARVLLLARRDKRTGIADLPTELIHDILRGAARAPDVLTDSQWAVLLRHAEDREALGRVAAAFTRRDVETRYLPLEEIRSITRPAREEFMFNGGFRKPRGPPITWDIAHVKRHVGYY
ncbi:hypothetical protein Q8F55_005424 [Vanrija albida]|uniref:Uncharacterized protein n=1 Tax=Vanrija albida TaxID=181172 RepID=A0ABR3Q1M0_9TREE